MIEIKHRFENRVLFKSETATTIKEAIEEAREQRADLSRAHLSGADLSGADLSGADLSRAHLSRANLFFCKMDKKVFEQITKEWFEWTITEEKKE
jgi:uncharacterized protein YjbI with pentapeptide repeats